MSDFICPYAKQIRPDAPFAKCSLKEDDGTSFGNICPYTRWCINERKMKMTDNFLKNSCKLLSRKEKESK